MEEWRQVKVNKSYEVSNLGRLRNKREHLIKPFINDNGYHINQLWSNSSRITYTIHRLIAEAFIPNPEDLETINHKNGDKLDNRVENLEWMSRLDNMRHAFDTGLNPMRELLPLVGRKTQFKPQFYHSWIYKDGHEYYGTVEDLVRIFPEHNLIRTQLHKLRKRYEGRTQHKGWKIKDS